MGVGFTMTITVHMVFVWFLVLVSVGLLWWVGTWVMSEFKAPPLALKVWTAGFLVATVFLVVNVLMSLAGHPIIGF